jgi:MFS transporter, PPP family, 3-phenylpropionic acid transporter
MSASVLGRFAPARLRLFYLTLFLVTGVNLPFVPSYLATKGLDAAEIGLLLAAVQLSRLIGNPLIARAADGWGESRLPIIVLSFLSLGGFAAYLLVDGFAGLMVLSVALGLTFTAVMPLADGLTLRAAALGGFDYGRVRLWGSLGFILASTGAGWLIARQGAGLVVWLLIIAWALTLLVAFALPRVPRHGATGGGMLTLLGDRRFIAMLITSSSIQASHSLLYAFGTIYWTAAGHSTATVGWLWAESVIAEVLLFAFAKRFVSRLTSPQLFVIGGFGAILRWVLAGLGTGLPLLIVVQLLHACSFAATHLAAMTFLARRSPQGLAASAQVLHAGIVGSSVGLVTIGSGGLYEALGGGGFFVMAAIALPGALLAISAARRSDA